MVKQYVPRSGRSSLAERSLGGSANSARSVSPGTLKIMKQVAFRKHYGGYLEVTLNLPRSVSFKAMPSGVQKRHYSLIWNEVITVLKRKLLPIDDTAQDEITFEYCESGHIHLHGSIRIHEDNVLVPVGLIADLVKYFLIAYSKYLVDQYTYDKSLKPVRYDEKNMYFLDNHYQSPMVNIRYRKTSETARILVWETYMHKCDKDATDIEK